MIKDKLELDASFLEWKYSFAKKITPNTYTHQIQLTHPTLIRTASGCCAPARFYVLRRGHRKYGRRVRGGTSTTG